MAVVSSRTVNPLCHLLIYATVVLLTSTTRAAHHCPPRDDINSAVRRCLNDYTSQLNIIQRNEPHFFGGVDVETLRALCSQFKTSMHCVKTLQNACPQSRHNDIDVALRPYIAMFDMCYTHRQFIEDYAMSQNCLYIQRDESDECYKQFLINTANHQYHASHGRQSAVTAYCRSLSELTACVRTNVEYRCPSTPAAHLVDTLVPLSTELSYKCSVFDAPAPTNPTPTSSSYRGIWAATAGAVPVYHGNLTLVIFLSVIYYALRQYVTS